jgi:hypothetical protein
MWPALPGPLPRIVPPEGLQVGSYFVPGGVSLLKTYNTCMNGMLMYSSLL